MWAVTREPTYLAFAVLVVAWAVLWLWGASRGRRMDARASVAPPYHAPRPGEAVVLGRVRWRRRGALRLPRTGVLLVSSDELLWAAGDLARWGRIGQTVPLGALVSPGGPDAGGADGAGGRGKAQLVAALEDLRSYRMVAGAFGADKLTLRLRGGRSTDMSARDPEVFVLLTEAIASLAEDGESDGGVEGVEGVQGAEAEEGVKAWRPKRASTRR
jgi:hypothetical protein